MRFRNQFDITFRRTVDETRNGVSSPTLVNHYVHLWHDYPCGQKPSSGKWQVLADDGQRVTLDYLPTRTKLTRLRSQVCTETESANHTRTNNLACYI